MSALDDLLDWCRQEQARLERDLDLMERGILTTGEQQSGSPQRDTTAESMDHIRRSLAQVKRIWARHGAKA
jgi:hypothetical protein